VFPLSKQDCRELQLCSLTNEPEDNLISVVTSMIWWSTVTLCAAAVAFRLLALGAVALWRGGQGPGWPVPPRVTLLKPLCGLEDGLQLALTSFLAQNLTSPVQFVFGAARPDDPALALARQIAAGYPECEVLFVADGQQHGGNPKVSNLINMAKNGLAEVVVISDSDVVIPPGALQAAIDALSSPGVGGVTSLYRGRPGLAENRTHSFGAWYLDYWALPMAALHARLGGLDVTYGPLTVLRGDVLERGGGLAALASQLCDDAALGRMVLASGFKLAFAPHVVETLVNDASPSALFAHELRWSRTDRGEHPFGNLATVVSHPGPLPLLLMLHPGPLAALGLILPILLRWLLARMVEQRFGRAEGVARPGLAGIWLRDMFCFAVWLRGLTVRHVEWRGQLLAMQRGGLLKPEQGA
jgi:ceramide glucosyltransferase